MHSIIQAMYEEHRNESSKSLAYREELDRYREIGEELQNRLAEEDTVFLLRLLDSANALREMDGCSGFRAGLQTGLLWMLKALE